MPRKPKRPCSWPGCPRLTEGRYCAEHAAAAGRQYERYGRDPGTKKRYGRSWERIRNRYARKHPLCELCLAEGKLALMEEVHHKLPLSEGGTHDESNLISLCRPCHARIHAERGDRWRKDCANRVSREKHGQRSD